MDSLDHILDAPQPVENKLQYAGFWIRCAAIIIDYIVVFIGIAISAFLFEGADEIYVLSVFVIILGYFSVMESSVFQATLGKMAVGIKVGNRDGKRLSWLNALGRLLAKALSSTFFYIGYMMAGWDPKKQALHDKLASTFVFYGR